MNTITNKKDNNVEISSFEQFINKQESTWVLTYAATQLLINSFTRVVNFAAKNNMVEPGTAKLVLFFGVLSVLDPMITVFAECPSPLMLATSSLHNFLFKPAPKSIDEALAECGIETGLSKAKPGNMSS